ncbi:hypothetical protein [Hyphomicrobium sp.]|uniref:hypothetical protein n=1 Tax=Hyphomicrobium sp. TaxID=82 RepID=UPI002D7768E5|nr:hypothetical protein [Hyphomicrobium sp.]HET6390186.1 hypothetical protein [Hyphomicrobium sp.]
MSLFSQSIAEKLKLAANKELAQRYARRQEHAREVQDRRGRTVTVVKVQRSNRSNGLLDD